MKDPVKTKYDIIIIGAGLSALSAGIRLSQFFDDVIILESHSIPGGLNSYYKAGPDRELFSSGLHTMTNATVTSRKWGLGLIARNLGIKPKEFEIYPPVQTSRISIPGVTLKFSNDNNLLLEEISKLFLRNIDEFVIFQKKIIEVSQNPDYASKNAIDFVQTMISDNDLASLLILPVFTYAGYAENDIDLLTFARIYRSIFLDGCGSPIDMKQFINKLISVFINNGGELCLGKKVTEIKHTDGVATGVVLKNGMILESKHILSSAGLHETGKLAKFPMGSPGEISLFQCAVSYSKNLANIGVKDSVHFMSRKTPITWQFRNENDCFNVVTFSAQDSYKFVSKKHHFKISCFEHISNWQNLKKEEYNKKKSDRTEGLLKIATSVYPGIKHAEPQYIDTFSPVTIARYTSHLNGTLYGGKEKTFSGATPLHNLFIIGNDQGGIGIMGALTSGILVSNYSILI